MSCPICLEEYTPHRYAVGPRQLDPQHDCQHSICVKCFNQISLTYNGEFRCAECRRNINRWACFEFESVRHRRWRWEEEGRLIDEAVREMEEKRKRESQERESQERERKRRKIELQREKRSATKESADSIQKRILDEIEPCTPDGATPVDEVRRHLKACGLGQAALVAGGLTNSNRRQRGSGKDRVYYFVLDGIPLRLKADSGAASSTDPAGSTASTS